MIVNNIILTLTTLIIQHIYGNMSELDICMAPPPYFKMHWVSEHNFQLHAWIPKSLIIITQPRVFVVLLKNYKRFVTVSLLIRRNILLISIHNLKRWNSSQQIRSTFLRITQFDLEYSNTVKLFLWKSCQATITSSVDKFWHIE